ncbi:MAG TPA: hypothetical protein VHJ18_09830 [Streptosporangiaceae bacterium]|nr:hypothetical protein [Streptosporangiaceae bacterium]
MTTQPLDPDDPLVEVQVSEVRLVLGAATPDRQPATLHTDRSTLMRLVSGRPTEPTEYELVGATAGELLVF